MQSCGLLDQRNSDVASNTKTAITVDVAIGASSYRQQDYLVASFFSDYQGTSTFSLRMRSTSTTIQQPISQISLIDVRQTLNPILSYQNYYFCNFVGALLSHIVEQ